MRFFSPYFLFLLIPWSLLVPLWFFLERRASQRFSAFMNAVMIRSFSPARKKYRALLLLFALFFSIFALARPQLGNHEETIRSQGLDIVFLLDVSNSMLSEDVIPNRLKKAKHVIRSFVDRLSGDRVGIVAFAGSSYPAVPLTTDYEFLRQALEIIDNSSISNQGTDLEKAIKVATELLDRGGVNNEETADNEAKAQALSSRVLVFLSDGEDVSSEEEAAKKETTYSDLVKKQGIRAYAIGLGTLKGAPIPIRDEHGRNLGLKRDRSGSPVITRLEPRLLESVAKNSGGKFFLSSMNEGEVEEIVSDLKSLDRSEGGERTVLVYDEVFQYPLGAALFLLFLFFLINEGSKSTSSVKRTMLSVFLLVYSLSAEASSLTEYQNAEKGVEAYQAKQYPDAIQFFGNAQAANPTDPLHSLNLGDAFLRSGAADQAIPLFNEVMKSSNKNLAAKGAFNLGKSYEMSGQHEHALRSYQQGLDILNSGTANDKIDPEIKDRIKQALESAQQQKQQQQNQENQDQQQQQQDQKNQPKDEKESKDQKDKKDQQKVQAPQRQKPKFKPEKLNEDDAKKILGQIKEQEKKAQQRMMNKKSQERSEDAKTGKDW